MGERMRSEETLSAKGEKRERQTENRLRRPAGGGPLPAPRQRPDILPGFSRYLLGRFRAARCTAPAHRYHPSVRTRKVFARAMAQNTRQPVPRYKYTVGG